MTRDLSLRRALLGCLLIAIFSVGVLIGQNKFGTPKSVIHVVTIKWKASSTPEQRQKALNGVKEMAAVIPGIKNVWIRATRVQPGDYNDAFVIEFENEAAAQAYGPHPKHKEWEKGYLEIREESRSQQITN
jgi:hypothetical protein